MTFEEQVAEALTSVLERLDNEHSEEHVPYIIDPPDLAQRLAPRVAAAIDRASFFGRPDEAVLAALRGEG